MTTTTRTLQASDIEQKPIEILGTSIVMLHKVLKEEANTLLTVHPSDYKVGNFIWGIEDDWWEAYRDFRNYMWDIIVCGISYTENLCRILRIEEVDDLEKDANPLLLNWEMQANEGSLVKEEVDGERISYRNTVLIRDKAGRYIIVSHPLMLDTDRPLVCLLPMNWREMFPEIVKEMSKSRAEFLEKIKAECNAFAADINARCRKWFRLLKPVPEGISICDGEYFNIGMENVATMAKSTFPRVQFSVSYAFKWDMMKEFGEFTQKRMNGRYILKWKNGPTEDEVMAACDFNLFSVMDFADKFGGVFNEIELKREVCDCDKNSNNSIKKAAATTTRKPSTKSKPQQQKEN